MPAAFRSCLTCGSWRATVTKTTLLVTVTQPAPSWKGTDWETLGKPDAAFHQRRKMGRCGELSAARRRVSGQLVPGWLKRVLDRINPYEARFTDFRNNSAPATYASMIQQAGPSYNGPVALNPNKDVIENTGLIQLYQTLLERAGKFGLSDSISDLALQSGVMNALQAGRHPGSGPLHGRRQ